MRLRAFLTMTALVAGAGLAACQKPAPQVAALPLDMGAAQPMGEAPAPGALPPAPPAQIAAPASYGDAYAYPDRAWGMSWAFGDSPPDYAFLDDGVTPWVWIADDDSECLVEPVPGGERYYYFEPGAYSPFYVQDPTYGYGFANGALAAIYGRDGREIAPAANPAAAATAGQYLARGRQLRQEAASQPHHAVAAANWSARRNLIAAQRTALSRDAETNPAWRAYHDQHAAQIEAHFAGEAARRETWAAQTDTQLGEPLRAQREQGLAQSISQGDIAARRPQLARNAAPAPAGRTPAQAERAPRTFAERPAEHPAPLARAAEEQGREAAYRAGPTAAPAEHRAAPHAAAPPRAEVFHAPEAHAAAAHAAPSAVHVAAAPVHAPPAHAAPAPAAGGGKKKG